MTEALGLYAKVAQQAADDSRLRLSRGRTERRSGDVLMQLGRYDEALAAFERSRQLLAEPFSDPDEERAALFERGSVLCNAGALELTRSADSAAVGPLEAGKALRFAILAMVFLGAQGKFTRFADFTRTAQWLSERGPAVPAAAAEPVKTGSLVPPPAKTL